MCLILRRLQTGESSSKHDLTSYTLSSASEMTYIMWDRRRDPAVVRWWLDWGGIANLLHSVS